MKKLFFVIIILLVAGFITNGVLRNIENSKKKVSSIPDIQREQGIPVEVKTAEISSVKTSRFYTGTIKGKEQADAVAKIQERIESIMVKLGDRVQNGTVVATLSRSNPSARFQQARLNLELAKRELERIMTLYKEGAVSASELDRQENAYKMAATNFESVEELLNIRAPITGVVTDIFIVEGQTVNPGQQVVRVSKFQEVELEIRVGESEIHTLSVGQRVIVRVSFDGGNFYEGKVDRIALSADPSDRSFSAWIAIPNKNMNLKPGMFASAELILEENKNVVVIDKLAWVNDESGSFVFVVNDDLVCEKRSVITGIVDGDKLEISKGIREGEKVVIRGQNQLKGGEKVLVIN